MPKLTPEQIARANETRARNKARRDAHYKLTQAAHVPQPPLTADERELAQAKIAEIEETLKLLEGLQAAQARLNKALYEFRTNTGAEDLIMMRALTLGIARDIGNGLLAVNAAEFGLPGSAQDDTPPNS